MSLSHSSLGTTPLNELQSKEFIKALLKTGSLISILENKKINITSLFSLLLERKDYRDFFVEITACSSFKEAVKSLLHLYPNLLKSKITKLAIKKINNGKTKPSYRSRKTSL